MASTLSSKEYRECFAAYILLKEEALSLVSEAEKGTMVLHKAKKLSHRGLELLNRCADNMDIALLDMQLMEIIFKAYHLNFRTMMPEKFEFNVHDFASRILKYIESGDSPQNADLDLSEAMKKKMTPVAAEQMCYQAPSLNTVLGQLKVTEKEKKEKAPREKRTKDIIEEVKKPEKVTKVKGRTLEETVQEVGKQLKHAYIDNRNNPINFLEFVIDPTSFSQTVENIFHISFLVNNADASIFIVDDDEAPMIIPEKHYQEGESVARTREDKNALVMTITQEEWEDAIEVFDIKSSMLNMKVDRAERAVAGSSRHR